MRYIWMVSLGIMTLGLSACEDAASAVPGVGTGVTELGAGTTTMSQTSVYGEPYKIVKDGAGNVLGWLVTMDDNGTVYKIVTPSGHYVSIQVYTGKIVGEAARTSANTVYLEFTGTYAEVSGAGYATPILAGNYPGPLVSYTYTAESDESTGNWESDSGMEQGFLASGVADRSTVGLPGTVGQAFQTPISLVFAGSGDPQPVHYEIKDATGVVLGTSLMNSAETQDDSVATYFVRVITPVGVLVGIDNLGGIYAETDDVFANESVITPTTTVVSESEVTSYIEMEGFGYLFDEATRQPSTLVVTPTTYPLELNENTYPYTWMATTETETLNYYLQTSTTATRADAGLPGTVGSALAVPLSVAGPYQ